MPELAESAGRPASRLNADTIVALLLAAAFLAGQVYLFGAHEPWRDEAQAWLKARDLATPLQFLIVPAEGHPPIWFWLLRALSHVLSFDQARVLMLGVAAINAWLLARLFGDRPLLLITLFCSLALLHSWGFHFRPYPLVLTCVAGALLLDRQGRWLAATWVLVFACGLSFFSGWLFAFWLLILIRRGTSIRALIAPSLVALAFGISAILSSMGNHDGGLDVINIAQGIVNGLSYPFSIPFAPAIVSAGATLLLLGIGLRRTPFILAALIGLLLLLAIFGTFIYGLSEWHAAFGLMLAMMAFTVTRAPVWPLALLLLGQDYLGLERAFAEIRLPAVGDGIAYEAILADAGDRLDTERNLVSWPDYLLTPAGTQRGFRYLSGNNGALIGAIDWRDRTHRELDTELFQTIPTPYWLVCIKCERPLALATAVGRTGTRLIGPIPAIGELVGAYRID